MVSNKKRSKSLMLDDLDKIRVVKRKTSSCLEEIPDKPIIKPIKKKNKKIRRIKYQTKQVDSPKKHNKPSTTHFITKLPKKNMPEQSSHIIVNKKQVNQHLQKESKKPYKVLSFKSIRGVTDLPLYEDESRVFQNKDNFTEKALFIGDIDNDVDTDDETIQDAKIRLSNELLLSLDNKSLTDKFWHEPNTSILNKKLSIESQEDRICSFEEDDSSF